MSILQFSGGNWGYYQKNGCRNGKIYIEGGLWAWELNLYHRSCKKYIINILCDTYVFILILQVETVDDYDEYCHYVAGLVGLGLSKLFHASGSEDLAPEDLSNSMGLFLQVMLWYMKQSTHFHSSCFCLEVWSILNTL